jgi:hypothetical protein
LYDTQTLPAAVLPPGPTAIDGWSEPSEWDISTRLVLGKVLPPSVLQATKTLPAVPAKPR